MSKPLTAVSGSAPSPEPDRPDHAASLALDRLGISTAGRRGRRDRRVTKAFHRYVEACHALTAAGRAAVLAHASEADAWARARSGRHNGHPEDDGRRGVPTWAYVAMLVGLWALNLPIAAATFQVFGESMAFTLLLAVIADAVFLLIAHMVGVTLSRAHHSHDYAIVLGVELPLGWFLFALGIAGALTSGWVRWSYLQATGTGSGPAGVLFTTILALATFLLATVAAWRHHHPAVAMAEHATRRRRRAERRRSAARRRVGRRAQRLVHAVNRRRLLAQRLVGKADRRIRHAQITAARDGTVACVREPAWLYHERRLADMPAPGSPMQPLKLDLEAIIPAPGGKPTPSWRDVVSRRGQEEKGAAPVE